jgi:amino acid transporter
MLQSSLSRNGGIGETDSASSQSARSIPDPPFVRTLSHAGPSVDTVQPKYKPVSFWGLVALIFFAVSGGPFGSEPSVASGGPFWAILAFAVFPLVWCIPEALITSELSSLFPGNTGFVSWVAGSYSSPFLGYVEGFCSFVSTATNSSVYPHLFLSYLKVHVPIFEDWFMGTVCMVVFILSMTYVNYRGLDIVSSLGLLLMVFIMAPFFLVTVFGISHVNPENWVVGYDNPPSVGSEELLALFNVLFWNLNNWDTVSTIAGEVSNARKVIPKALITALVVTTIAYVIPLAIGTGVMKDTSDLSVWEPGYFQKVALEVGGNWLSIWILLAASVSVIGQFQALVSSCSYQLQGMAELGWLPKFFARKSKYDTPTVGLAIALVIVLVLTQLQFIDILQYLNVVYACAQAIEFSAFLYMRYRYPHINRPFRVPLSFAGCCMLMVLPFCFIGVIVFLPVVSERWDIVIFCMTALVLSVVTYVVIEIARARGWLEFIRSPPQNLEEVILVHKTPGAGPLQVRLLSRAQHSLDSFGLN